MNEDPSFLRNVYIYKARRKEHIVANEIKPQIWFTKLECRVKLSRYPLRDIHTEVLHLGYKIYSTSARLRRGRYPAI